MKKHPKRQKDLDGNKLDFSVKVLIFDEQDYDDVNVGFYNYDSNSWTIIGDLDDDCIPVCWCYAPNPKKIINRMQMNGIC